MISLPNKKKQAAEMVKEAEIKAKEILVSAKEEVLQIKKEAEEERKKITKEVKELEARAQKRQEELDRREKKMAEEQEKQEEEKKTLAKKRDDILDKLEKVAKLSQQEAKQLLLGSWEEKLKKEIAQKIKVAEEESKNNIDEKAKEILAEALKFGATDYVAEYTLSTVDLPNEEFKGRIIGKEGRNIRAFELSTGVDVSLEDEGVVRLSSFDAVKREIARVSMEKLIRDGRIQPERIEAIVKKTKNEIEKIIIRAGEELCHKVGVYNLPFEIIKLLGRFKYRYSYGQNMIVHTLEETRIGTALAYELKCDVETVKLGCLLHDLGKVITDKEGSHVQLGGEFLKKQRIPQAVIDCVVSHHEDVPFKSVEAVLVYVADAVSGGRPGARHEDFQEYLKRIEAVEQVAKSKKGVADAYALQAGRELRVIVKPEEITDEEATVLSEKIREEIEEKFPTFPGQVKITVIREFRAVATSHS